MKQDLWLKLCPTNTGDITELFMAVVYIIILREYAILGSAELQR
jgi:hypothetical protein